MIDRRTIFRGAQAALVVALGLLTVACGKSLPPPINITPTAQLFYSDESHMTEVDERVIRNESAWRQVWGQITEGGGEPPEADFRNQMLLMVNGGRMDPGDRIQIDRLEHRGEEMVVMYRVIEDCGTLESDVYPIQVVAVEKRNGPLRFESQHTQAAHCRR